MPVIFALLVLLGSQLALSAPCGRIISMRGMIEVLRLKVEDSKSSGSERVGMLAQNKMELWCSDIILTRKAARAKIRLVNKTSMTLGPQSRIELQNYLHENKDVNRLKLTYGKVRALFDEKKKEVPKELPQKKDNTDFQSRLLIRTPGAIAGVRGTDFYISYDLNKELTEQATLKGKVEIENEVTGQKVQVTPGQQVEVQMLKPQIAQKVRQELAAGKTLETIETKLGETLIISPPKPIEEPLKESIRQTSAIAKNDKEFTKPEVEKVLGPAKTWQVPSDEIPLDFQGIKEEF